MPDQDSNLPADPDLRQVRFHVDYGSPGGFAGTIIEDPDRAAGTDPWLFYAEGRLVASADAIREGWVVHPVDHEFIRVHAMTATQLESLFERASYAVTRLNEVFAGPAEEDLPRRQHTALPSFPFSFRLNRAKLKESMDAEGEKDQTAGIDLFGDTAAEQIAGAVIHAENAKAILIPDGVELTVLKLVPAADAVLLTLRETPEQAAGMQARRHAAGLPGERQVATWQIDASGLCGEDNTFGGLCATLEQVCELANGLVPVLRALLDGEETLLDLMDEPLTVITFNNQSRLGSYRTGVEELTEGDPDITRLLWPLLIQALESGEAAEDWDGDRQRTFQLEAGGERYLARALCDESHRLIREGAATPGELPEPENGFAPYLRA